MTLRDGAVILCVQNALAQGEAIPVGAGVDNRKQAVVPGAAFSPALAQHSARVACPQNVAGWSRFSSISTGPSTTYNVTTTPPRNLSFWRSGGHWPVRPGRCPLGADHQDAGARSVCVCKTRKRKAIHFVATLAACVCKRRKRKAIDDAMLNVAESRTVI